MLDPHFVSSMDERMKKSLEAVRKDLMSLRTGHASPAILDKITVEAYDTEMPLKQLASVSAPEARLLVIQPFDKSVISGIEKAILKSDLGLTPQVDGAMIRLPIPQLTEERRKDLAKVAKKKVEDSKISIRNIRRDANEALRDSEKKGQASEDEVRRAQEHIQKITDKYSKELDDLYVAKEKEIMHV